MTCECQNDTYDRQFSINIRIFDVMVMLLLLFAFLFVQEVLQYKLDNSVALFLVAVIEYIAADILNLAGKFVLNIPHEIITQEDIRIALIADQVRNYKNTHFSCSTFLFRIV